MATERENPDLARFSAVLGSMLAGLLDAWGSSLAEVSAAVAAALNPGGVRADSGDPCGNGALPAPIRPKRDTAQ